MGPYGPEDVRYLQRHGLPVHIDRLLSAFLALKPPHPEKYFRLAHRWLQVDYPDPYSTWRASAHPEPSATDIETGSPKRRLKAAPPPGHRPPRPGTPHLVGEDYLVYRGGDLPPAIQEAIVTSAPFDPAYPAVCDGRRFSLQNAVHWKLRLAASFLRQIGRDTRAVHDVKSARGHFEYGNQTLEESSQLRGLPNVKLVNELSSVGPDGDDIEISAARLHEECVALHGEAAVRGLLTDWAGWTTPEGGGARALTGLGLSHCGQLYGPGVFRITRDEVCDLERSVRVYTGPDVPPPFFLHLVGLLSRDTLVEYYNDRKAIPLAWLATSPAPECEVGKWVAELVASPEQQRLMGFPTADAFARTIQQSITELSTQVCIAMHGYFFGGTYNQLRPKPHHPVVFLAAPGIDFNSGAASRSELSKYFLGQRFKPGGREALKQRVKRTYHLLFTACRDHAVTHPTAIAMGLGLFLPPIEGEVVKALYHEAQFELLAEGSYGFDTYFLNPGPGRAAALRLLDTQNYPFQCRVVLHGKDGKTVASHLAQAGLRTSFLNPSDCIAVMQGCMGYWWETGMGERYAGEEDFCATSTALVARANVCTLWAARDHHRILAELRRVTQVLPTWEAAAEGAGEAAPPEPDDGPHPETGWPAYPQAVTAVPNPPEGGDGFLYQWLPPGDAAAPVDLRFRRILWVDTRKHHALHLQPMVNRMRRAGIVVDIAHSTADALAAIDRPGAPPLNFVLTALFTHTDVASGAEEEVATVRDSGHALLRALRWRGGGQQWYFRTACASMTAISSRERSTLYSEGCAMVKFDLHRLQFEEVMARPRGAAALGPGALAGNRSR